MVPDLVVTEVAYLIGTPRGTRAEIRFLGALAAGEPIVEHFTAADWLRIAELVGRYHNLALGTVDASIVVRPVHVDAFSLAP